MKNIQLELVYVAIATVGGVARYLNTYQQTGRFVWGMFFASCVVSGFSGYMGALVASSLNMPQEIVYISAGIGGFMGEQALKFIAEWIVKKIK